MGSIAWRLRALAANHLRARLTRTALATVVAIAFAVLTSRPAWGHTFPPVRTVVLQVERCEVVALVGYRAGTKESSNELVARIASRPKSQAKDALREVLTARAMTPLTLSVDGAPLVPTSVRAKLGSDGPGGRAMVILLVTYALPAGKTLGITSRDPRNTRISWTDRQSGRVALADAPAQGRWFPGVASFLLSLLPPSGGSTCAPAPSAP